MVRAMIFIDGTWLYSSTQKLSEGYGKENFQVDFGKLPRALAEEASRRMGAADVDVVRTYLFGSYAANYDLCDEELVQRRRDFFTMLKEEFHYEVEVFPVNFLGRRVRRVDRDPLDTFEPKEKCVDVSMATMMLYYAAIPHVYDVAIAVLGDGDFVPALQHVRMLGKRVAIASIRGACSQKLIDTAGETRVKDFDLIWLNDILPSIELKYEPHQLECQAPTHRGARKVWTTFHPRKEQKFYCEECRAEFQKQKFEAQQEFVGSGLQTIKDNGVAEEAAGDSTLSGTVKNKNPHNYGFIAANDGRDYFFHLTDLDPELDFKGLETGTAVVFEVRKVPSGGKAGAAQNVRAVKPIPQGEI